MTSRCVTLVMAKSSLTKAALRGCMLSVLVAHFCGSKSRLHSSRIPVLLASGAWLLCFSTPSLRRTQDLSQYACLPAERLNRAVSHSNPARSLGTSTANMHVHVVRHLAIPTPVTDAGIYHFNRIGEVKRTRSRAAVPGGCCHHDVKCSQQHQM